MASAGSQCGHCNKTILAWVPSKQLRSSKHLNRSHTGAMSSGIGQQMERLSLRSTACNAVATQIQELAAAHAHDVGSRQGPQALICTPTSADNCEGAIKVCLSLKTPILHCPISAEAYKSSYIGLHIPRAWDDSNLVGWNLRARKYVSSGSPFVHSLSSPCNLNAISAKSSIDGMYALHITSCHGFWPKLVVFYVTILELMSHDHDC